MAFVSLHQNIWWGQGSSPWPRVACENSLKKTQGWWAPTGTKYLYITLDGKTSLAALPLWERTKKSRGWHRTFPPSSFSFLPFSFFLFPFSFFLFLFTLIYLYIRRRKQRPASRWYNLHHVGAVSRHRLDSLNTSNDLLKLKKAADVWKRFHYMYKGMALHLVKRLSQLPLCDGLL